MTTTVAEKMSKSSRAVHGALAPCITVHDGQAAKAFVERELSSLRGSKQGKAEAISAPNYHHHFQIR